MMIQASSYWTAATEENLENGQNTLNFSSMTRPPIAAAEETHEQSAGAFTVAFKNVDANFDHLSRSATVCFPAEPYEELQY